MRYIKSPEQLQLLSPPYRYIIDACSVIAQNPDNAYPRDVHKTQWQHIDDMVRLQEIITCSQIQQEVIGFGDLASEWVSSSELCVVQEDWSIQQEVIRIVNDYPSLLDFNNLKSSGDAFLIATAKVYGLDIITQEKKTSPKKIPYIAQQYGIKSYNLNEFCRLQGWSF